VKHGLQQYWYNNRGMELSKVVFAGKKLSWLIKRKRCVEKHREKNR